MAVTEVASTTASSRAVRVVEQQDRALVGVEGRALVAVEDRDRLDPDRAAAARRGPAWWR